MNEEGSGTGVTFVEIAYPPRTLAMPEERKIAMRNDVVFI